ncbi:hypothetical protein [Georgenia sp. AZ-5]|uniref:hypothetical protein n=1 Tax=Georgenia sp. AZ-5 TaxID=3367526 RepID=UPI0037551F81
MVSPRRAHAGPARRDRRRAGEVGTAAPPPRESEAGRQGIYRGCGDAARPGSASAPNRPLPAPPSPRSTARAGDHASPEDIQRAYTTARAWAGTETEADRTVERIREEIRTRYGIDVDNTGAELEAVREAMARAEVKRGAAEVERSRAAGEEEAEAYQLVAEADRADQAAATARACLLMP